jgi:hypothetical protein
LLSICPPQGAIGRSVQNHEDDKIEMPKLDILNADGTAGAFKIPLFSTDQPAQQRKMPA